MIDRLVSALFLSTFFLAAIPARAALFFTDTPAAADVWVIVTTNAGAADCWVYTGDITSVPTKSDVWAVKTDNAGAADKWIIITDNPGAADDLSCLVTK